MTEINLHCLSRSDTSLHKALMLYLQWIGSSVFSSLPVYIKGEIVPEDFLNIPENQWKIVFPPHTIGSFSRYDIDIGSGIYGCVEVDSYKNILSYSLELDKSILADKTNPVSEVQFVLNLMGWIISCGNCYLASAMVTGFTTLPYFNPPNAPRLIRSSNWDAIPWPQWINYYSDHLIDRYGKERLLSAPWEKVERFDSGYYFVVTDHVMNYDNASDCQKLDGILHSIEYSRRFWEQATSTDAGTITYDLK